jgi:hypothetical protein
MRKQFRGQSAIPWFNMLTGTNTILEESWKMMPQPPPAVNSYDGARDGYLDLIAERYGDPEPWCSHGIFRRLFDELFFCFRKDLAEFDFSDALYAVNHFFQRAMLNRSRSHDDHVCLICRFGVIIHYLNRMEMGRIAVEGPGLPGRTAKRRFFYLRRYREHIRRSRSLLYGDIRGRNT